MSFYNGVCYGEIVMLKRDDELAKQKLKETFEEYKKTTLKELERIGNKLESIEIKIENIK